MQATETRPAENHKRRAEAVLETVAAMTRREGTITEVAHDARNMVTALSLYCDLLSEPGVLSDGYLHYANELRLVAATSRRLVEKLMILDFSDTIGEGGTLIRGTQNALPGMHAGNTRNSLPGDSIDNLQNEVLANCNLLDAMAGLGIALNVRTEGGARPVRLSREELTRVLVNLVKNAAEAMREAGSIGITLSERADGEGKVSVLVLVVEDSGPGIPEELLEQVFAAGYTTSTQRAGEAQGGGLAAAHRGLGLSITRAIIEAAGGRISASNGAQGGARFSIELPVSRC